MKILQDATFDSRGAPDAAHTFFRHVIASVKDMGFESCSYKIQMPVPISRPIVLTFDSSDYESSCCGNKSATLTNDNSAQPIKSEFQIDWRRVVHSLPLEEGAQLRSHQDEWKWTFVSRDASSGTLGQLTLVQKRVAPVDRPLSSNGEKIAAFFTSFAHDYMANLLVPKYVPAILLKLTPREKEVLRWTAEGKTSSEIGQILSVSVNTVLFHLKNVVGKLGASNKTQAAVKATALGLLW